ncbi:MAG: replication initiation protein [Neisseriaceae bacterium]
MADNFEISVKNKKFRQSNHLIESPYAQEFSAHEIKIFEIATASCKENDYAYVERKSDKEFFISNKNLANLLNTSFSTISHEIENTAKRIMKKMFHLRKISKDGTVEFEMINIIPYARYKDGIFHFRLNYAIIPYLVEVNGAFTEFQLHYLLEMNSAYAIKLYKLLYQRKDFKTRTFLVDDLKLQFGVTDKYPEYKSFKQRVLNPSVKQINEKTDLRVTYKEEKLGRRVIKIKFITDVIGKKISLPNQVIDVQAVNIEEENTTNKINSIIKNIQRKISKATEELIKNFYLQKGEDYVVASIKYAKENSTKNFDKYLKDTLNGEYALDELYKIEQQKNTKNREDKLKMIEAEKDNKRREELAKKELEVKETFYNLSVEDRTSIYAELVTKVAKICPDKMDTLIKNQEDYIVAYWAGKNKLKYKGHLHLSLEAWKILG